MKKIKAFILGLFTAYCREFKLVLHDTGLLLFLLFLPLAYPVIYSLIYNPELVKEVPLVVVDNDRTSLSRELVRNIDACDEAWVKGYAADMGRQNRVWTLTRCLQYWKSRKASAKRSDAPNIPRLCFTATCRCCSAIAASLWPPPM